MGICYNCFREKQGAVCPHCGYDGNADAGKYPQALPCGSILAGKYITGRVLGQGGFGITYLAYEELRSRPVAIKEFFPDPLVRRENGAEVKLRPDVRGELFAWGRRAFLEEAMSLSQLSDHPNIVSIYDCFEENNTAYFAMEYVPGESLDRFLRRVGGRIPPESAKAILLPITNALSAAHAYGLLHRDVTPDNIMILPDSSVKLLDFGSARCSLGVKSRNPDAVLSRGFSPPEEYAPQGIPRRCTDVYALAATYCCAVTGRTPPAATDRLVSDGLILPSALGISLPPQEESALAKALALRPEDRFQTVEEFRRAMWEAPERPRFFTVTWKNPDESVIDTTSVPYGTVPTHEPAFRPSDGRNSFTFSAWFPQPVAATCDTSYMATYEVKPLPPRPGVKASAAAAAADSTAKASAPRSVPTNYPSELDVSRLVPSDQNEPTKNISAFVDITDDQSNTDNTEDVGDPPPKRPLPLAAKISIAAVCCALIALVTLLVLHSRSADKGGGEPVLSAETPVPVFTEAPAPAATAEPVPTAEPTAVPETPVPTPAPTPSAAPVLTPDPILHYGGLQYRLLEDGSAVIVSWNGRDSEAVIPPVIDGAPVTAIGEKAFFNTRTLTDISIPHGVVSIGKYAFFNCTGLEAVSIPDTVTSIGEYAFDRCKSLTGVRFAGTQEQWEAIGFGDGNQPLNDAEIRFILDPDEEDVPDVQWVFYIAPSAGTGGSISPSETLWYPEDGSRSQTFTITPDPGWSISDVIVDGKSVGARSSYTFSNISASHTIEARFAADNSGGGSGGGGGGSGGGSGGGGNGGEAPPSTYDDGRERLELGGRVFYSDDTTINLQGLGITDISVLAKCTQLKNLNLNNNSISDLSPLKNLTTLTTLQLNNNNISDLSPLANLTNLEKLYLLGNNITDWSPVSFVPVVQGRPNY